MLPSQRVVGRNDVVRDHEDVRLHDRFRRELDVGWRCHNEPDPFRVDVVPEHKVHVAHGKLMGRHRRRSHQQLAVEQLVARPWTVLVHEGADICRGPAAPV
jgi:hypothetical protein